MQFQPLRECARSVIQSALIQGRNDQLVFADRLNEVGLTAIRQGFQPGARRRLQAGHLALRVQHADQDFKGLALGRHPRLLPE